MKKSDMPIRASYFLMALDFGCEVELDLGCGAGGFAIELAKKFSERMVIAVDAMQGRLEKLCKKAQRLHLDNIVAVESEAAFFLGIMLPEASIDRIHLLCPDPWPKKKHRYHRLLTSEFSAALSRKLKPGGIFHFSSDDIAYCRSAERIMSTTPEFLPLEKEPEDICAIRSDFEKQWLSLGKNVEHLYWRKTPAPSAN